MGKQTLESILNAIEAAMRDKVDGLYLKGITIQRDSRGNIRLNANVVVRQYFPAEYNGQRF